MHSFEKTIYYAVLISSIILGIVFAFFTVTIFRNQRRYYKALQARFLAEIEILDNERARIARDLHDELGPLVILIRRQIAESDEFKNHKNELLAKAYKNIDEFTERLKGIAHNLTPAQLIKKGLGIALNDFLEQLKEVSNIQIQFRYEVKENINPHTGMHIYRIIQEIVNNAVKHSGATYIDVHLRERDKNLYILCKDDGKGMEIERMSNKSGMGLNSLKSRTEMLGGWLQFQSKKGTEYFIEIPLNNEHG